uniref:Ribosomal protein S7 n=2 Tax=Sargassum TaxID=3015 RepID=A0A344AL79_9PHAE|nr:ribosomal protein S7 [Sargassum yezoense]YP_009924817.1 ribosomal protein S7 [Sargassum siliquastrum]YP_010485694.1 ribosomal protein S7 [Sargassum serratifolium]AWV83127.1 ribosomal protein S7 [Sargassum yezoense]QNH69186.1 ribosomal protein S7 [Sargassum siliquastrum]UVW81803.1 ribosomal protein S7 [Sargassum serratifolium]
MLEAKHSRLGVQDKISLNVKLKETFNFLGIKKDPLVGKMINLLMKNGKRSKAEKVLNRAFQLLDEKYPGRALHIFYFGVFEARRDIGIRLKPRAKKRRAVNAFSVYLPYTISPVRGLNSGMRALLAASRRRSPTKPFWDNLSQEILESSLGRGEVVTTRYSLNKLADSNKRRVHLGSSSISPVIFH